MIKGSQLVGRAVIDMDAAERLGRIKEIIVQHDGERVAGFVVVHGETIVGTGGKRRMIPASALHSIGPDAITVRGSATKERLAELENLPRMSDIIGHKMVTRSGRLLGLIDDMLINGADGTILGFAVGEGVRNKLESIFNPRRSRIHGYVRADADLHVGKELIIVPDDALIEGEPSAQEDDHKPAPQTADETKSRGWGECASAKSTRSSIWTRRTDPARRGASQTPAEVRTDSETAHAVEDSRSATPAEPRIESETARPAENNWTDAPAKETAPQASPPVCEDEPVTATSQDQSPK
jgi:uncharacterized protein YrrD